MNRSRTLGALTVCGALVASVVATATSGAHAQPSSERLVPLVAFARAPSGPSPTPFTTSQCLTATSRRIACYNPAQLATAYDLKGLWAKGLNGKGQTIVVVDAFGSPTIAHDLSVFDATFHLPAPPSFKVITPVGPIAPFSELAKDRTGWAFETSLDVEWAHAIAPRANILLVETPTDEVEGTSGFPDIVAAENYVIAHHLGSIFSMSFGATEGTFTGLSQITPLRSAFIAGTAAHATFMSGTGDEGSSNYQSDASTLYTTPVSSWPDTDPLVTAVGGTKLSLTSTGSRTSADVVWNDQSLNGSPSATGGGLSSLFARPSYQNSVSSVVGAARGVPDISMSGACSGLVDIYVGISGPRQGPGWYAECGTSESTPLLAGIVAIADQLAGHPLGLINPALYALGTSAANGVIDVTHGSNAVVVPSGSGSAAVAGYSAKPGYDLASGLGTIDAAKFIPALVKAAKAIGPVTSLP
jgi:subtilase family serine protease